jgi:hypothetical protein
MKYTGILVFFGFLLIGSCTAYRPMSQGQPVVDQQFFYDELSPYGYWVHNRQYGYVWIPHVGRNFFPYATDGSWVATDYGWTWVSDFDWGWAPFHYGRWDYDPTYGWFWFPGYEWAPAWVNWREGNGYYGWSPMRPDDEFGYNDYRDDDIYRWVFVRDRDFGKHNIDRYYVSRRRNDDIIRRTSVIRDAYPVNRGGIAYNPGPDPADVERSAGRRIRKVEVRDYSRPGRRMTGNQLEIYRPRIEPGNEVNRPAPPRITDIKDIRPMRERNRNYQPGGEGEIRELPDKGQGTQDPDIIREQQQREQQQREIDARRQYEEKQVEMQKRRQDAEQVQIQRSKDSADKENQMMKGQKQRRERIQNTGQQKKQMQKDRSRQIRETERPDTVQSRRSESEQAKNVRQKRR